MTRSPRYNQQRSYRRNTGTLGVLGCLAYAVGWLIVMAFNLAVIAGLVVFIVWLLRAFGVIS